MFIKAIERVQELNDEGYRLSECDKESWFLDFISNSAICTEEKWKPTEEQIGALNYAYCELFKREDVGHNILGPLQDLCDDLRKLSK